MRTKTFLAGVVLPFVLIWTAGIVETAEKKAPTQCEVCGMKITAANKSFSVMVTEVLSPMAFDDIGCAIKWRDGECAMRQEAFDDNARAHDYETGASIAMAKAVYVRGAGVKTPMGHDVLAFASKDRAKRFAAKQGKGKVLSYGDLIMLEFE